MFDNNEGYGGFLSGACDINAIHPIDVNWTRQSKYKIPDEAPNLLWKLTAENTHIDTTVNKSSFVIDKNNEIILTDCDNYLIRNHYGRVLKINNNGEMKEIFRTNRRLKSPTIGSNGNIFVTTTTGSVDAKGHKLYCLNLDGDVEWEFLLEDNPHSKPVFDDFGNVYIYTYSNKDIVGKLYSISKDGKLNWEQRFNSINWHEPVISKNRIIYIGLNVKKTLCALDLDGRELWNKKLGDGLGNYPFIISRDDIIYACISSKLYAIKSDGEVKWSYIPNDNIVATPPAIDYMGNLFINLSAFKIQSLNNNGKIRWENRVSGAALVPPIIGKCGKIYQQSFMQDYPCYKSWIDAFTNTGELKWTYNFDGTVVSTVLGNDNLIYILTNIYTYSKKGWKDKMIGKWELHAIGSC